MPTRTIVPEPPVDLAGTLFPIVRGRGDLTAVIRGGEVLRAIRGSEGPATLHLRSIDGRIECEAWGPGAGRALDDAPELVGALDDWSGFTPYHDVLRSLRHEHPGLRLMRNKSITSTLIPVICEQKVTGQEARRAYRLLTKAASEPAPGPGELLLPPDPERITSLPSAVFHRCGLDGRRGGTLRFACSRATRLDALVDAPFEEVRAALAGMPGVGPWTTAEVMRLALGDPDAVSVGDFHLPNLVAWLLAGEPRGTDERMLQLLAPYAGQRGRVQLLLEASGAYAPRYGPRMEIRQVVDE